MQGLEMRTAFLQRARSYMPANLLIAIYLCQTTRGLFSKCSVPWRRHYLLHAISQVYGWVSNQAWCRWCGKFKIFYTWSGESVSQQWRALSILCEREWFHDEPQPQPGREWTAASISSLDMWLLSIQRSLNFDRSVYILSTTILSSFVSSLASVLTPRIYGSGAMVFEELNLKILTDQQGGPISQRAEL